VISQDDNFKRKKMMKGLMNLIFSKLFGIFRIVFLLFFAYCTTIMKTSDHMTNIFVVIASTVIIIFIILRYIYVRNDNKIKEALNTGVADVVKNNRNDILGTVKMMVTDFFIGVVSLIILFQFLKTLL
jgi:uncharacterized membrane protein (DUF485 family)